VRPAGAPGRCARQVRPAGAPGRCARQVRPAGAFRQVPGPAGLAEGTQPSRRLCQTYRGSQRDQKVRVGKEALMAARGGNGASGSTGAPRISASPGTSAPSGSS
jgi:hypothetical protein